MNSGLSNAERSELLARLESQELVAAFSCLVDGLSDLGLFVLSPNILGRKKALNFKSGKVSYFAFIANKEWLLWYFRRPGLKDGIFTFDELKAVFPSLTFSARLEVEKLEAVLRIRSVEEVDAVLSFVRSKAARLSRQTQ